MVAQAAAAPVYVAGAALFAGAAYLLTPHGRRTSESFGEAVYDGGAQAVENITNLFSGEDDDARATPTATTTTTTQPCDGPHRGRLQVQGYDPNIDPFNFTSASGPSWGWNFPCIPPNKAMGLAQLSTNLLAQTRNIREGSANLRYLAFVKMSQHIARNPTPQGFYARHVIGFNHLGQRALGSGRNVPRVDLEVILGRAFGTV